MPFSPLGLMPPVTEFLEALSFSLKLRSEQPGTRWQSYIANEPGHLGKPWYNETHRYTKNHHVELGRCPFLHGNQSALRWGRLLFHLIDPN